MTYAYFNDTEVCRDFQRNPGKYCGDYVNCFKSYVVPTTLNESSNFTGFTTTFNISDRNLTANASKEKG